eukprot:scaffold73624_cov62-Phaeocystis_antarctica.AAC.3
MARRPGASSASRAISTRSFTAGSSDAQLKEGGVGREEWGWSWGWWRSGSKEDSFGVGVGVGSGLLECTAPPQPR